MNTNGALDKMYLPTSVSPLAWIIKAELKVGTNAQNPGNRLSSSIVHTAIKSAIKPTDDNALLILLSLIFKFKYAKIPPIDICQNLQNGK